MKDAELASEDAFQKRLADIEKKNNEERKKAYDDLIQTRINLQNSLKTKSLNYNDIFKMSGAGTSGSTAASSAARKLAEETDKARKAYENLTAEIQRMKFNALDAIEQENTTYANRMTVLKTALENSHNCTWINCQNCTVSTMSVKQRNVIRPSRRSSNVRKIGTLTPRCLISFLKKLQSTI